MSRVVSLFILLFAVTNYSYPQQATSHTLDKKFFLINGLHVAAATLDVVLTQHCIQAKTCKEGNPMMPSSVAGQVGVDVALIGYGSFVSYKLKKHKSKVWWLVPTIGITAHGVGAGITIKDGNGL
jgi:hypothetical protein